MFDLLRRVITYYRGHGLLALLQRGSRFLLNELFSLPLLDELAYRLSVSHLSERMRQEDDLDDVLDTAFDYRGYGRYRSIAPLQIREEFRELVEEVADSNPTTVMEIGTANGGTFYTWCRCLDTASMIISLDLPEGDFGGGYTRKQTRFFQKFSPNKELVFIRKDSHDDQTLQQVRESIPDDGVDFLFIDGDHRYEGVKQDFEMYRQLVSDDGMIAFHDIVYHPNEPDCEVDRLWNELKKEYETDEILESPDQIWAGIGILYP